MTDLSLFGTVSLHTHRQALTGLKIMVELFTLRTFVGPKPNGGIFRPVRLSPGRTLPTPAWSNDPRFTEDRTPMTGFSPASHHHGLVRTDADKACPCRPLFAPCVGDFVSHRIER